MSRNPPSSLFATLGVALLCVISPARADWVELDNGDRLSGRIDSLTATTLHLDTAYAGTLALPRERISALSTDAPLRVRLSDGTEFDGQLVPVNGQGVRIRISRLAETEALPLNHLAALNPPSNPDATEISARVSAGGSFARGNTEAQSLHVSGEMVARNTVQRVTLDGAYNQAEQAGVQTVSNARLGLKYDHFVSAKAYWYANTRFERDDEADLDLRSTLGAGAGWQVVDSDTRKLALESGLSYASEDYGSAPDQRFPGARLALKAEQALWGDRVRLFHDSDLLVSLESVDDYLLRTRTGVRVPVAEHLSLGTTLNYDYDNVPAPGKKTTDTALIFQVDYAI
jgi:putative salt-induced outer membrane protein YdiY